jgi:hypothetical protein
MTCMHTSTCALQTTVADFSCVHVVGVFAVIVIELLLEGSVKLGNRTLSADDLDYVPQFDDLNEYSTVSACSFSCNYCSWMQ